LPLIHDIFPFDFVIAGKEFHLMGRKVLCAGTDELARSLSAILTHAEFEPEV
jgi:hypothetical protein